MGNYSQTPAPSDAGSPYVSRRRFIEAAAGVSAMAALGGLFGCAPKTIGAENAAKKASKTVDCDVLVVGAGGAGVTAAAKAAQAGANTVVIEKMGWPAGSSSLAIGTLYGAGTKLQERAGIKDSWEGLYQYFLTRGGDKLDDDMQKFCAQHFGETIDWLSEDMGVAFKETVSKKGKDTVARGHSLDPNANVLLQKMYAYAKEQGAQFTFEMAAESLIVDNDNNVLGVLAHHDAETYVEYKAKKTIIASGGFCRNEKMIAEYMPDYDGVYTEVGVGCTGEGLQMGLDIGADYIGHGGTNGILACAVSAGQSKLISNKAMWVDPDGKRFNNEAGQTHDIYYQVAHFKGQHFYAVYDQTMVNALNDDLKASFQVGMEKGIFKKGDTVKEAAAALGLDGDAVQAQLDEYNQMAAAGEDTQFKKKADYLIAINTAPFYVLTMGICTHGSFGGYHVNTDFQVLDKAGKPIGNLYAAGEVCCGSFIYDDYPAGGCGLNFSYTSGRFAGTNAAEAAMA